MSLASDLGFETVSFIDLGHVVLPGLAGQLAPSTYLSLSLGAGPRVAFRCCCGSEMTLMLGQQALHSPRHLLSPLFCFEKGWPQTFVGFPSAGL